LKIEPPSRDERRFLFFLNATVRVLKKVFLSLNVPSEHSVGLVKVDLQPANLVQHARVFCADLHHIGIIEPACKHTIVKLAKEQGCCTLAAEAR
jgi:hypothetical protein